ncbi:hypothetical protein Tco_1362860 [Tanacetum coccineum]
MQKSKSYRSAQEHRELYDGLDKDEDPPARSDQGLKRRKTSKDVEPSKGSKSKESKSSSSKDTNSHPKSFGKSVQAEESVFETPRCHIIKEFKKPERPPTPDSDWNARKTIDFRPPQTWISKITKAEKPPLTFDELMSTPIDFSAYVMNNLKIDNLTQEHLEYPFDLGKPLPLIEDRCRQVVPVGYFINNDLEYLKGNHTLGPKRQRFYGFASNRVSKHDVYSTKRIIAVTHVKVMKWYDYGYLEEIEVRREDQKLYKFKEVDFPRLNLRDIEYIRVVILKRVEDLQLGVESYQKKLNITKPKIFRSDISKRTPYNNPQGIIYVDKYKRNRLMRSDELYKFSDGTLTSVRYVLHDIASNLRMDYLPKRRLSTLDKQRSRIMIKAIDKLQLEGRLMRNLEKFVGGREYREDFRLLERTI